MTGGGGWTGGGQTGSRGGHTGGGGQTGGRGGHIVGGGHVGGGGQPGGPNCGGPNIARDDDDSIPRVVVYKLVYSCTSVVGRLTRACAFPLECTRHSHMSSSFTWSQTSILPRYTYLVITRT